MKTINQIFNRLSNSKEYFTSENSKKLDDLITSHLKPAKEDSIDSIIKLIQEHDDAFFLLPFLIVKYDLLINKGKFSGYEKNKQVIDILLSSSLTYNDSIKTIQKRITEFYNENNFTEKLNEATKKLQTDYNELLKNYNYLKKIFLSEFPDQKLNKLKAYRIANNISKYDLCRALNINATTYHSIEDSIIKPTAKQIKSLCNLYKCTTNDLFGFDGIHILVTDLLEE